MSILRDAFEVVSDSKSVTGNSWAEKHSIQAPSGKKVLSGGFDTGNGTLILRESWPESDGSAWNFRFGNGSGNAENVTVYAVCVG